MKEAIKRWLGLPGFAEQVKEVMRDLLKLNDERIAELQAAIDEQKQRIDDLESAYPDYKKAKAKADDEKANEIVPGFTPFTQRKRQWEATRRRPQKKS